MRELVVLILVALLVGGWLARQRSAVPEPPPNFDALALLSADAEGFRRVEGPAPVVFPGDHAAHPDYRHEWWYFTGSLDGPENERYGFQFTLFRFALPKTHARSPYGLRYPQLITESSAWHTDQIWMAHLALSDVAGKRFLSRERFARGALDLAGATTKQWWLKDWRVTLVDGGWRLHVSVSEFALELEMKPARPHVLQGERGYSRKGPEPGNASCYVSWTRLKTSGVLHFEGRRIPVEGLGWLDREWGSGALSDDLAGWDWFALQLDDGRDLMYYRLRRHDGSASPFSAGVLVGDDGEAVSLDAGDVDARVRRWWRDGRGDEWPVAWELSIPGQGMVLRVEAAFDAQLWETGFRYWEGAVDVFEEGYRVGRGYLETTGYSLNDES